MTSDREILHRRVLDNPADDALRLVYADCLDETGKPWNVARAELIRLQIGRLGAGVAAVAGSLKREEEILARWGAKWIPRPSREEVGEWNGSGSRMEVRGEVIRVCGAAELSYTFERGFLSTVAAQGFGSPSPSACAQFARECLANNPIERFVFERWNHEPRVVFAVERAAVGFGLHNRHSGDRVFFPARLDLASAVVWNFMNWLMCVQWEQVAIPF